MCLEGVCVFFNKIKNYKFISFYSYEFKSDKQLPFYQYIKVLNTKHDGFLGVVCYSSGTLSLKMFSSSLVLTLKVLPIDSSNGFGKRDTSLFYLVLITFVV